MDRMVAVGFKVLECLVQWMLNRQYTLDIWSCDAVSRLSPKLLLACTYNVLTSSISSYSLLVPKFPINPLAMVTVIQPATTMVTISRASRAMSTAEEEKLTVWTWESEPE